MNEMREEHQQAKHKEKLLEMRQQGDTQFATMGSMGNTGGNVPGLMRYNFVPNLIEKKRLWIDFEIQ